jgi:hypothetical protein
MGNFRTARGSGLPESGLPRDRCISVFTFDQFVLFNTQNILFTTQILMNVFHNICLKPKQTMIICCHKIKKKPGIVLSYRAFTLLTALVRKMFLSVTPNRYSCWPSIQKNISLLNYLGSSHTIRSLWNLVGHSTTAPPPVLRPRQCPSTPTYHRTFIPAKNFVPHLRKHYLNFFDFTNCVSEIS